jgi:hypothetical protein
MAGLVCSSIAVHLVTVWPLCSPVPNPSDQKEVGPAGRSRLLPLTDDQDLPDAQTAARALEELANRLMKGKVDLLEIREERGSDLGEVRLYVTYRQTRALEG